MYTSGRGGEMKTKTVITRQQLDDTCKMKVGYDLSSPMVKESRRKTPPIYFKAQKKEKKIKAAAYHHSLPRQDHQNYPPQCPCSKLILSLLRHNMKIILVSVVAYNRTQWIGLPYAINYKLDLHKLPGKKYIVKMPQMTKTLSGHTQVHEN